MTQLCQAVLQSPCLSHLFYHKIIFLSAFKRSAIALANSFACDVSFGLHLITFLQSFRQAEFQLIIKLCNFSSRAALQPVTNEPKYPQITSLYLLEKPACSAELPFRIHLKYYRVRLHNQSFIFEYIHNNKKNDWYEKHYASRYYEFLYGSVYFCHFFCITIHRAIFTTTPSSASCPASNGHKYMQNLHVHTG